MIRGRTTMAGPQFADAARWAGAWVPANPDVTIRGGIRIKADEDGVTLEAYDGASGCRVTIGEPGAARGLAVVSGRLLAALAPTLGKADVTIEAGESNALRIVQGRTVLTLPVMPEIEWSSATPAAGTPLAEVDGGALAQTVKRVALAAAERPEQGHVFSCLWLGFHAERLSLLAATREHFAAAALDWSLNFDALGPTGLHTTAVTPLAAMMQRAAEAFAGADAVTVACSAGVLTLSTAERSVTVPLIDCKGKWPAAQVQTASTRPYAHSVTVSRRELITPLKQAVIVREKDGSSKNELEAISLRFRTDEITVGGHGSKSTAEAATPVDADGYSGPDVPYRFNPAYLKDALDGSPGDIIRLEFQERSDFTGVRFTCTDDPSWWHLVAPINR